MRWALCLSSLVIILIAAAVAATIVQGIYSEAIDNIQDQITMSSQEISRFVADKIQAAQVLADRAERLIQDGDDTNGFRAVAEQMKPFYDTGVFSGIGIADLDGTLYAFDGKTYDISGNEILEEALKEKCFVSSPTYSREDGMEIIAFVAPVIREERLIGIMVGSQRVADMQKDLAGDFYRGNGFCHIVDNNGNVIIHSPNPGSDPELVNIFEKIRNESRDPAEAEAQIAQLSRDFLAGDPGLLNLDLIPYSKLLGYISIPEYSDWNVLCVIKKSDIWLQSRNLIAKVLLLAAGAIAVMVGLMIYLYMARRQSRQRLEKAAYCDNVTGGWNYNYFRERAPGLLEENKNAAYVILRFDINHFRSFNDRFGYETGDRLLKCIYRAAVQKFPEAKGQLTARMYSDEFVTLCRAENAPRSAEELDMLLAGVRGELDAARTVSLSLGIYAIEDPGEYLDNMVDKARLAQKYYKRNPLEHSCAYSGELLHMAASQAAIWRRRCTEPWRKGSSRLGSSPRWM